MISHFTWAVIRQLAGCISVMLILAICVQAADEADDDDDQLRSGLVARHRDAHRHEFGRVEKTIVFAADAGQPDRRLAGNQTSVRWKGLLSPPDSGVYRFYAEVAGHVQITLRDRVILDKTTETTQWVVSDPVEFEFDFVPWEVIYETTSATTTRFALFWSGPNFPLEPISPRNLFHDPQDTPKSAFERGEQLVRGLRCAACHVIPGEPAALHSPALEKVAGNLREPWLVKWLTNDETAKPQSADSLVRRMPHFGFLKKDAQAIASFMLHRLDVGATPEAETKAKKLSSGNAEKGKQLALTLGCLACHKLGDYGTTGVFAGGNLSVAATKRPPSFFSQWLSDPASLNRKHRMPVFELTTDENNNLSEFLRTCGVTDPAATAESSTATEESTDAIRAHGRQLFFQHRCDACHDHSFGKPDIARTKLPIAADAKWDTSCLTNPKLDRDQPGYRLIAADAAAIREFFAKSVARIDRPNAPPAPETNHIPGRQLLIERNCVACHARDESRGLSPKLLALLSDYPELAIQIPAMTPPALLSVGDKLKDEALVASIRRTQPVHRPWLKVRMPKFALGDDELHSVVHHLAEADRIGDDAPVTRPFESTPDPALQVAGSRLVTVDGFGCTSCHQVGKVSPVNAPQNARGPDISQLGSRIRLPWFDRWVRNPARIVPGMEMPSMQLAVRGVLAEDLNRQLAAVWQVLNTPGFEPPEPNPVKTLRLSGLAERGERAEVVSDLLKVKDRTYVSPLLIGLPNRHSILFDLERNQLARWSVGDIARLRTRGKAWFWEAAGTEMWSNTSDTSELMLLRDDRVLMPQIIGQFLTEIDEWRHIERGVEFKYRLRFGDDSPLATTTTVSVQQRLIAQFPTSETPSRSGFIREFDFGPLAEDVKMSLRVLPQSVDVKSVVAADRRSWRLSDGTRVAILSPKSTVREDGTVAIAAGESQKCSLRLLYSTDLPVDQFIASPLPAAPIANYAIKSVPGFDAARLPLPEAEMPTALAWQPNGDLAVASLKGRVWLARDTDGDGLEDAFVALSDELAAPYGLAAGRSTDKNGSANFFDVSTKIGVMRLYDEDGDGHAERTVNIASGWGHTEDYHDWVIGLPHDSAGNYFVGIPCQQDKRGAAGAYLRGTVQKLIPRTPTADNPRLFSLQTVSAGHRFPMGMAFDRRGELFVTDNQGNYNPFNELNHVRQGAHFGFINAIEKKSAEKKNAEQPPVTPAAIELPHPWTRSVNGICFFDTPQAVREKHGRDLFGPFEGHLLGCEYDTRRLIRMSLQPIGDTFQGAAYPLSSEKPSAGPGLLGPLCCEVSPAGDIYVGSIRDSGWGGGNNIGEIVRLRFQPKTLPIGIAEVRAVANGFEFDFTAPVDPQRAGNLENYSVASYRRISTPSYGGPDQDRRIDHLVSVKISSDARHATLQLAELREGFVYELRTKNLAPGKQTFFPGEAYFTLRKIP